MELFIIGAVTLFGVGVILLIPRWLRYTTALNTRKQEEALSRRWTKS